MKRKIFNTVIITLVVPVTLTLSTIAKQSSELACQPGDGICSITTDASGDMHVQPGRLIYIQNQYAQD